MIRRALARLVDAEVRRLTDERDEARRTRAAALGSAVRWHLTAQAFKAQVDTLAAQLTSKENRTWQ